MPYHLELYKNLPLFVRYFDEIEGNFALRHLCSAAQPPFNDIYRRMQQLPIIFDPDLTPEEWLEWLGQIVGLAPLGDHWLGTGINPAWPAADKRRLVKRAWTYWQIKGTELGLREAVHLWLRWPQAHDPKRLKIHLPLGKSPTNNPPYWHSWNTTWDDHRYRDTQSLGRFGSGDAAPGELCRDRWTVLVADRPKWDWSQPWASPHTPVEVRSQEAPERLGMSLLGPKRLWEHFELSESEWHQIFPDFFELAPFSHSANATPFPIGWLTYGRQLELEEDPIAFEEIKTYRYEVQGLGWGDAPYGSGALWPPDYQVQPASEQTVTVTKTFEIGGWAGFQWTNLWSSGQLWHVPQQTVTMEVEETVEVPAIACTPGISVPVQVGTREVITPGQPAVPPNQELIPWQGGLLITESENSLYSENSASFPDYELPEIDALPIISDSLPIISSNLPEFTIQSHVDGLEGTLPYTAANWQTVYSYGYLWYVPGLPGTPDVIENVPIVRTVRLCNIHSDWGIPSIKVFETVEFSDGGAIDLQKIYPQLPGMLEARSWSLQLECPEGLYIVPVSTFLVVGDDGKKSPVFDPQGNRSELQIEFVWQPPADTQLFSAHLVLKDYKTFDYDDFHIPLEVSNQGMYGFRYLVRLLNPRKGRLGDPVVKTTAISRLRSIDVSLQASKASELEIRALFSIWNVQAFVDPTPLASLVSGLTPPAVAITVLPRAFAGILGQLAPPSAELSVSKPAEILVAATSSLEPFEASMSVAAAAALEISSHLESPAVSLEVAGRALLEASSRLAAPSANMSVTDPNPSVSGLYDGANLFMRVHADENVSVIGSAVNEWVSTDGINRKWVETTATKQPVLVAPQPEIRNHKAINFINKHMSLSGDKYLSHNTGAHAFILARVNQTNSASQYFIYASQGDETTRQRFTLFMSTTTTMKSFGTRLDSQSFQTSTGDVVFPLDWMLVEIQNDYPTGIVRIYLNGQLAASGVTYMGSGAGANTPCLNISIGNNSSSGTAYLRNADIAEMLIYNAPVAEGSNAKNKAYDHFWEEYRVGKPPFSTTNLVISSFGFSGSIADGSGLVSQWKSVNHSQAAHWNTATTSPVKESSSINGLPSLRFTGDQYSFSSTAIAVSKLGLHLFIVLKINQNSATEQWAFAASEVNGARCRIGLRVDADKITGYAQQIDGGAIATTYSFPVIIGDWMLVELVADFGASPSLTLYSNGYKVSSTSTNLTANTATSATTPASVRLGARGDGSAALVDGNIAHVALYERALAHSSTDRASKLSYLQSEYGFHVPTTYSTEGMFIDLDADKGVQHSSNSVSGWKDGTGAVWRQSSASSRPTLITNDSGINGHNSIDFASDYLVWDGDPKWWSNGLQGFTWYCVFSAYTSIATTQFLFWLNDGVSTGAASNYRIRWEYSTTNHRSYLRKDWDGTGSLNAPPISAFPTTWVIASLKVNYLSGSGNNYQRFYNNGVLKQSDTAFSGSIASTPSLGMAIGATMSGANFVRGLRTTRMMAWNRITSSTEDTVILNQLRADYGILAP